MHRRLSLRDRARQSLRHLEFRATRPIPPFLYNLAGVGNPISEEDRQLRSLFIHIPKTAGTSLRAALYGTRPFRTYHIPLRRYVAFDRSSVEEYFAFCFVRNPWSRLYSAYEYLKTKVGREPHILDHRWANTYLSDTNDFEEFVLKLQNKDYRKRVLSYAHFRDQLDWIQVPGLPGKKANGTYIDFIGHYETIQHDFDFLRQKLDSEIPLSTLRQGEGHRYREVYTDRMREIVAKIYRRDIAAFGYDFDS